MNNKEIHTTSRDATLINNIIKEQGVVVIDRFLSPEVCSNLESEFEDILDSPDTNYKKASPYSNGRSVRVNKSKLDGKRYPNMREVFSSNFVKEVAKTYFSGKAHTLNSEIFVVNDVVGTRHLANDLHFDVKPTFKFFIYLTDTTAENGAFSCVPGSHKITKEIRAKNKKISFKNREVTRELPVEEKDVVSVEGKAGSLIIFTTDTFHRAGTVLKGERKVVRGHCRAKADILKMYVQEALVKIGIS